MVFEMLRRYIVFLLLLGLALGVSVVGLKPRDAAAAPVGAATGQFVASQSCQGNGLVSVRFIWGPSGWGPQWVDVSLSPTFNGWANAGPIGAGQNFIDFGNLLPNTTYFSRIATYAGIFLISDPIAFVTGNCAGSFSPPHNLRDDNLNNGAVRFRWDPGVNNFWYCLDVAESVQDLVNLVNSWRNFACGTTSTTVDVSGLPCGKEIFWRVWAVGPGTTGYSGIESHNVPTCAFSPPTNLQSQVLSGTSVRFSWDRGVNNDWFCVDTGPTEFDLLNFTPAYRAHGCGTTGTTITATGLACGTKYFWRVFSQGSGASGHSVVREVTTAPCAFSVPHSLDTDDVEKTSAHFDWVAGTNNLWYCVDLAKTLDNLLNFNGTWFNRGCGTTNTFLNITGLDCGTLYYWRVFAFGGAVSGHSATAQVTTDPC
jgi:hypothetical protein